MLTEMSSTPLRVDLTSLDSASKALRVFFRLADRWNLNASERQNLLGVSRAVFSGWQAGEVAAGLDPLVAERLSYVFRIHAALQMLLPVKERADAWLRQPNTAPLFGGRTALQRMLSGEVDDLRDVAEFLDAERAGDYG